VELGSDTRIALLGAGVEGMAVLAWLQALGCNNLTVCDKDETVQLPEGVEGQLGDDYMRNLDSFQVIFRSPGFPRDLASIQDAESRGSLVTSATREFFARCPCTVVGVTGSNGKSTATDLIASVLQPLYGASLHLGGNDHEPLIHRLHEIERDHCVVMELSSFQLLDLERSPNIAVMLNISPNHLDFHSGFEDYLDAKSQILNHQTEHDYAVLNYAYGRIRSLAELSPASKIFFNDARRERAAYVREASVILHWNGQREVVLPLSEVRFMTNPDNLLAATLVGKLFGLETTLIRERIRQFKGRAHCLEFVRRLDDVSYYDDSGGTTPEAAINALRSFPDGRVVLLAGGSDKGVSFDALAKEILRCRARVMVFGATKDKLASAIAQAAKRFRAKSPAQEFGSLEAAVEAARKAAKPGHSVVLSPACASFDMFSGAAHRGERFQEIVRGLS
jgi:UDP-N-acetylmuramoylalanine--D-glutamate ligase